MVLEFKNRKKKPKRKQHKKVNILYKSQLGINAYKGHNIFFFHYPSHSQNCTISHLYLHGNRDYLLCADQCGVLCCDVCGGAAGFPSRRCGKQC